MSNGVDQKKLEEEIERRRTFAIISHPDAGKTTLTEKLLLYGGAIHLAGSVKARRAQMHATSDWMELEKERGISITSSVLQFIYQNKVINLLDTPGHKDFSEDTYRTLMAADSAVMLLDHAKGVEVQTIKLFEVCRMRGIPIFTFINKLDRFGKNPFELLDEVEKVLGIQCAPLYWPIGQGTDFKGVYHRAKQKVYLYSETDHGQRAGQFETYALTDSIIQEKIPENLLKQLHEDLEILDGAGTPFDPERFLKGEISPVFWGSAMTNFGVQIFLEDFIQLAPKPLSRNSDLGPISPASPYLSGFIFKIQANMDPKHRDRIAFMRICSGTLEAGDKAVLQRTQKEIRISEPQQLMANQRQGMGKAYPGDVVGVYDTGVFHIGDSLSAGPLMHFEGIPHFSPEMFCKIQLKSPLKRKQMLTGLTQITEEGGVQLFYQQIAQTEELVLGAVGQLQLEVLQYRLINEYGADLLLQYLPHKVARWVEGPPAALKQLLQQSGFLILLDRDKNPVLLFETEWACSWQQQKNPEVLFKKSRL